MSANPVIDEMIRGGSLRTVGTEGDEMSEEEWSSEEIQEAVDELIKDIGTGYYDEHIRVIARACFKRRDALTGSHTVVTRGEDHKSPFEKVQEANATVNQSGQQFPPGNNTQPIREKLSRASLVQPVPLHHRVSDKDSVVTIANRRFYKRDFVGKTFVLPHNINPAALQGCTLLITGLGDRMVKTEIASRPNSKRGKYYQMWGDKSPLFIQKTVLMDFCDMNT